MNDTQQPERAEAPSTLDPRPSTLSRLIGFCLRNKLVIALFVILVVVWGLVVAPFDWELDWLPREPVPVDAIPDIGENQQIVFTKWPGRSPQDVQDQITFPLTASLLGISGVRTVRSISMFGFSSIYVIFREGVDFDTSRNRILTKLNSLPAGSLPEGVRPALGPEATALGQIFWYTLEGRDRDGNPTGGWDLDELRTAQDWYLRFDLMAARDEQGNQPIAEVGSVGGFVREYQVDVDPDAMRAHGVRLDEVFNAVRRANVDVGARTIEINKVEYVIRGLGFIEGVEDIEHSVIKVNENVPIYVKNVAKVGFGPALRRGALDKEGTEAVGAVVVVRYGANPLSAIKAVKAKLSELGELREGAHGPYWLLHSFRKTLPDGRVSHVAVVPFYDRTGLIYETLGTLSRALTDEILITIIVVVVMVLHLRSSVLISGLLPLAVLMCFIAMKLFGVDANIVALSGIAIAIGTMVDMGIVVCENILRRLDEAPPEADRLEVVHAAAAEVGSAVFTAIATTVVSFLPVFTMVAAEGKLFRPLAFTKTFALVASVVVALAIIPPFAHILFAGRVPGKKLRIVVHAAFVVLGIVLGIVLAWWVGAIVAALGAYKLVEPYLPKIPNRILLYLANAVAVAAVAVLLTRHWLPLGPAKGLFRNLVFVAVVIGGVLGFFLLFRWAYEPVLRWCLRHKALFLLMPVALVVFGLVIWLGFDRVFGFVPQAARAVGVKPEAMRSTTFWVNASHRFRGLSEEFMPPLDEGSFLLMPTTMPHASIGECLDVLRRQDMAIRAIPEVATVVGKIGRVESPLDPAPISMVETVITYRAEFMTDRDGRRIRFRYDEERGEFVRDANGQLIPDPSGRPYRQWRPHIKSPDDIWHEILEASRLPGTTSAPKLQPIAARIVMLQSGMRASMGIKVTGPGLETIERVALQIERFLRDVPSIDASTAFADRIVGKPYLEIDINRTEIARYGIDIRRVQDVIEVAIGGRRITTTVEGRERYPVRVRYLRELRDRIETLGRILVPAPDGTQIPLIQLAGIRYVRGPQAIKSEDTFLLGYVIFDKRPGYSEVDVVEAAKGFLNLKEQEFNQALAGAAAKARAEGRSLTQAEIDALPGLNRRGCNYEFAGTYENQVRARRKLALILPLALFVIFMILYFQFRAVSTTFVVFSGVAVAWAGGFLLIWLYDQPWFLDFSVFGVSMRQLFQVHTINLSVAVWVGFLALFGIATDDGVVMATYLRQRFHENHPVTVAEVRASVVEAGVRRVRPCLMTTATTILALIPVLTSTGRGADVMVPMAIPSFGGMLVEVITMFVVPVLFCSIHEFKRRSRLDDTAVGAIAVLSLFTVPVVYCTVCDIRDRFKPEQASPEETRPDASTDEG